MVEVADKELDHLVKNDILSPVENSDWAFPVVLAKKHDGWYIANGRVP